MSAEIPDADLVVLARDGDPAAFRLLVERHQPMVRARARSLCGNPSDVDDVMQESFLQAFIALDRLRDPERFVGWLAAIVLNVCRAQYRRAQPALLPDWPESLHPASPDNPPSAEDLDLSDALRAAIVGLPDGQRRAVALHYYAGLPAGQIAGQPGTARVSLHKARGRLRAYLTEHRPDLIPVARRTHMTTVRVTRMESRIPPGPVPDASPTHIIVLVDAEGRRELAVWLLGGDSHRFADLFEPADPVTGRAVVARPGTRQPGTANELTDRLLHAVGARVASVDIDELGPEVTGARIELASHEETRHVLARLPEGIAVAITAGVPIRVADALMDRLATPASGDTEPGPMPEQTARDLNPGPRPRYEPRNMTFTDGMSRWVLGGTFGQHASEAHWADYTCAVEDGAAVLSAAVPEPAGFAFLAQEIYADDYLGRTVTFRGRIRTQDTGNAGLFVRVRGPLDVRGPVTAAAALADPSNHVGIVPAGSAWTEREITAGIPADASSIVFGIFLAGHGRIELKDPGFLRQTQ
ncbi:MAG TPA: bifunctional nuclease domain-containing protein [Trebonia sp.]|nr:bifunctional nuclease domain-containing protein [Trebonia sp.]